MTMKKILAVCILAVATMASACAKAGPMEPPKAKSQVVKEIADKVYGVTAFVCGSADLTLPCSSTFNINTALAHEVLSDSAAVSRAAGAAAAGWEASVKASWEEAKKRIGSFDAIQNVDLKIFLKILDAAIAVL